MSDDVKAMSVGRRLHELDRGEEEALARRQKCGQCGQPYEAWACGPTHAIIASERKREAFNQRALLEGRQALADALLSELDGSRPDFALICQGIGRADGLGLAEVAMLRHGWQALADHLRAWLEAGAPERPLLNEAWARINALGGTPACEAGAGVRCGRCHDCGGVEAVFDALAVIESLGGHDPAEKKT